MTYLDILRARLIADEGVRNRVYPDTKGRLTLGVGHNIQDKPIRQEAVDLILDHDMQDAEDDARAVVTFLDALSDVRKAVVIEMAFQLGRGGLFAFQKFQAALAQKQWDAAADAMMDSEVAKVEAPARWERMSNMMRKDSNE